VFKGIGEIRDGNKELLWIWKMGRTDTEDHPSPNLTFYSPRSLERRSDVPANQKLNAGATWS
jgi:hypothetical protein